MNKGLRRTLELPLPDESTITIDVTFRIIEIVERVYNMNADFVVSVELASPTRILRHRVADVIVDWLSTRDTKFKRQEIKEFVMTAPPELLNVFSGCIQAAVLYSLKYIGDEQFEKLAKGLDLEEPGKPPGKEDAPPPSSPSATE